jgi:hypothetical protein
VRAGSNPREPRDALQIGRTYHVIINCVVEWTENQRSARQRLLRRRMRCLPFRKAVRCAANVFFRFKFRATKGTALWSGAEHVWLGRETFINWALSDNDIEIPWVVAEAALAPLDPAELRAAVVAELSSYWKRKSAALPRRGKPFWHPLP